MKNTMLRNFFKNFLFGTRELANPHTTEVATWWLLLVQFICTSDRGGILRR
jgi:hypothetical protein